MQDLVLLVADKNMQFALKGALQRPQSLLIRPIEFDFRVHAGRDGGVRTTGPQILKLEQTRFQHALMVLDWEGSGAEGNAIDLERKLDSELHEDWGPNAKVIVITPEVDVWMWGSDNSLANALAWTNASSIRDWIRTRHFRLNDNGKPHRPKEALEAILRELRQPRSSALYQKVAEKISLERCTDESFQRLKRQLQLWFPSPGAH